VNIANPLFFNPNSANGEPVKGIIPD
jgi:hypothetical protein